MFEMGRFQASVSCANGFLIDLGFGFGETGVWSDYVLGVPKSPHESPFKSGPASANPSRAYACM